MTLKEMKMLRECYKREVEDVTHWSTESERRLFFATLLFNLECEIEERESLVNEIAYNHLKKISQ